MDRGPYSEIAPQFVDIVLADWWMSCSGRAVLLTPNHVTGLLLMNLNRCNMFLLLFLFSSTLLIQHFVAPASFETYCCHKIQDELIFFHETVNCLTYNIECFLCTIVNKMLVSEISWTLHSILIYILHDVPTFFLERVCMGLHVPALSCPSNVLFDSCNSRFLLVYTNTHTHAKQKGMLSAAMLQFHP